MQRRRERPRVPKPLRGARSLSACVAALLLASAGTLARGAEKPAPARVYAKAAMVALGYLRSVEERFPDGVRLLVLHAGDPRSQNLAFDTERAFRDRAKARKIGGRVPLRKIERRRYSTPEALRETLERGRFNCVFLSLGLGSELDAILPVLRERQAVSITCTSAYVRRGVSLGVALRDGRLTLFVNRTGAREEKLRFKPALLTRAVLFD